MVSKICHQNFQGNRLNKIVYKLIFIAVGKVKGTWGTLH